MISRQDSYLLFDVERGSGGDAGLDLFLLVQTVLSPSTPSYRLLVKLYAGGFRWPQAD